MTTCPRQVVEARPVTRPSRTDAKQQNRFTAGFLFVQRPWADQTHPSTIPRGGSCRQRRPNQVSRPLDAAVSHRAATGDKVGDAGKPGRPVRWIRRKIRIITSLPIRLVDTSTARFWRLPDHGSDVRHSLSLWHSYSPQLAAGGHDGGSHADWLPGRCWRADLAQRLLPAG